MFFLLIYIMNFFSLFINHVKTTECFNMKLWPYDEKSFVDGHRLFFFDSIYPSPVYSWLFVFVFDVVVTTAQCIATFSDLLCSPKFRYYKDVNMLIKFCSEAYFSGLRFFNEPEISDSGLPALSPFRRTCAQDFYVLKKFIYLSRVWTWDLEASTVPRDHRGRQGTTLRLNHET